MDVQVASTSTAGGPQEVERYADKERERIERRRKDFGVPPVNLAGKPTTWGLALSGGGIRSATVGLGVLQALARTRLSITRDGNASPRQVPLLHLFDYLSTVSGGGYVGSFFCSLFVPGRRSTASGEEPRDAAEAAYQVLEYEPPGRLHFSDTYSPTDPPGKGPLGWLRDNGRYLSPTGAGDTLYGAVLAIRNWASIQYVLGTIFLLAFALVALFRRGLDQVPYVEQLALASSPLWLIPLAVASLAIVPLGIAFWLANVPRGHTEQAPARFDFAAVCSMLLGVVFIGLGATLLNLDREQHVWQRLAATILVLGSEVLLACVWFAGSLFVKAGTDVAYKRVLLTRWLKTWVFIAILASALIAIDQTSGWAYQLIFDHPLVPLSASALLAAAVWLIRFGTHLLDETRKPGGSSTIPLNLLATVAGGILLFLVAVVWGTVVQSVEWLGQAPKGGAVCLAICPYQTKALLGLLGIASLLAITTGMFPGFVNVSTLQSLYGARLTRAYLGASNGLRFAEGTEGKAARSVAEPIQGDQLSHAVYYGDAPGQVLAPLHIINITMNQTVDPTEQLVQRDRKGKPMAVLPHGFSIDDEHYKFQPAASDGPGKSLSIGQWTGTSGAAFTTGLGRATSLGFSFLLGMANIRLGTWWESGCDDFDRTSKLSARLRLLRARFPTQWLILSELGARFRGLRRPWQYLSDGGHFENTGIYELLRKDRHVDLVVVCDNGRDMDYQFEDLANLIRLARIDFRLEIEVDIGIAQQPILGDVFGTPEQFDRKAPKNNACAMLLNVREARSAGDDLPIRSRIILLKPRLIDSMPVDVRQYAQTHTDFPQESTSDQFFNEAQWESYRKLGLTIGLKVFGGEVGKALWRYLGIEPPVEPPH